MIICLGGHQVLLDEEDTHLFDEYRWHIKRNRSKTYVRCHPQFVYLHRMVMNAPVGIQVDHINGNGLDNRKENLRLCTTSQNLFNRGKNKNNTSGLKGVGFDKRRGTWYARIEVDRKTIFIGSFPSPSEAHEAYKRVAIEKAGEFVKW